MQQQDVEQLVEQVAQRLGRGLSLEDLDGLLLAYSSNESHADRVRVNFLLSKRVPVDVIAWQLSHGIATAARPVVVPANEDLGMLGRVSVPLLVRGFRVGYLWVQLDAEEPSAATVLTQLPDVAPELEQLSSLLLDSNTAESEFRRRREQEFLAACAGRDQRGGGRRGLERGPRQGALAAGDRPGRGRLGRGLGPIADTLTHRSAALQATIGVDAALFRAGAEPRGGALQGIHGTGRPRPGPGPLPARTRQALRAHRPADHPGHQSEGFAKPRELAEAYRQSRQAAQAAAVDPQLGELVDCRAAGVYQLPRLGGRRRGSLGRRGIRYLRLLEDYDRNHELLPVLELFYDNDGGGSVQEVAANLHLHRSSIYNRLGRIRQLLGVDPLKGMVRLELHAGLKARRWAGRPRISGALSPSRLEGSASRAGFASWPASWPRSWPGPAMPAATAAAGNPAVHPERHRYESDAAGQIRGGVVQARRGSEDASEQHSGDPCHDVPPSEFTHIPSLSRGLSVLPRRTGIVA